MDKVYIKGLVLYTLIGVYEFERKAKQRIIVDIEMDTNLQFAGKSDNVADTLDYGKVVECMEEIASATEYQLVEALGEHMANSILTKFCPNSVTISINKPDILKNVDSVGITLTRCRERVAAK